MATGTVPKEGWQTYLLSRWEYARARYATRNARIRERRAARLRLTVPFLPDSFRRIVGTAAEYRSSMAMDLVARSRDLHAHVLPKPVVIPIKRGEAGQENSSKREKWLRGAYEHIAGVSSVYGEILDALFADSMTVWKSRMRFHRYTDVLREDGEDADVYNERVAEHRRGHFPFTMEHVDAETFYPLDSDDEGFTEVLEVTWREAMPLAQQYGLIPSGGRLTRLGAAVDLETGSGGFPETARWIECWTRTHYVYMVDEEVVKVGRHGYGIVPYFWAPFAATSIKDPQYQTEGLLDPLIPVQEKLNNIVTALINRVFMVGYPTGDLEPVSDEAVAVFENQQAFEWQPGSTIQPPLGWRWKWTEVPGGLVEFTTLLDTMVTAARDMSLAPILYGQATDLSGPTSAAMIAIGKSRFAGGLSALARAFDRQAAWWQRMVAKRIGTGVPIWTDDDWLELTPDDIGEYYTVRHTLNPVIPLEQMQRSITLADAQARGAVSMRYYREEGLGLEAPEEMAEERWVEDLAKTEMWMAKLWEVVMLRLQADPRMPGQVAQQAAVTPALPVGPGGPVPQVAGVQQGMQPGMTPSPMVAPAQPVPVGPAPAPVPGGR